MKTNAFGKPKKLRARIFSACVLFVFVATQNASHPAFAFLAAPVLNSKSQTSRAIQPDFNLITQNWSNHSLASLLSPVEPLPAGLVSVAWNKNTIHAEKISGGISLYELESGRKVKRYKFVGGYAEVFAGNNSSLDGKINVLSRPGTEGDRALRFIYSGTAGDTVKIVDGKSYRTFQVDAEGRIGNLLETGGFADGVSMRERIYDHANAIVTVHNPANVYEKRTYELKRNHELGRLVLYRDRDARGSVMSVRFLYDPRESSVTCVYLRDMSFSVYKFRNQRLGALIRIGTAKFVTKSGRIVPRNVIGISEITRGGSRIPVYSFSDSEKNSYVLRERSLDGPEGLGPVGRVLRYSGEEGDFEYIYEESETSENSAVVVLNYNTGKFLKFEISKKELVRSSADIAPILKPAGPENLKALAPQVKMILFSEKVSLAVPHDSEAVGTESFGNRFNKIRNAFERGPPAADSDRFFASTRLFTLRVFDYLSLHNKFSAFLESLSVYPFTGGSAS